MKVIVCIDDNNGMMFNNRRQSKDELLRKRIMENNDKLFMNEYSYGQFEETGGAITVCEDFLDRAGSDDACFVENCGLSGYADKISRVTVYRWNRSYPFDTVLDLDLSAFSLESSYDFAGNSHEKITEEVYVK